MYRQHFGLRDKPFRIVPSPRFLFASETHDESRVRILYGIRESRGFVVITGGIGLGKTTVLLSVLDELDSRVRTALIFNPVSTFEQLLRMVAYEFGLDSQGKDEVELLQELNLYLVERMAAGETCVLLIDEAQNLSVELMEKIRGLSNLQTENASLLQIVLVGQPELQNKLDDPRLMQLKQRVGVWHVIRPLTEKETEEYILHRLRLAGAAQPRDILSPQVCHRVYRHTRGIPRLVNQLCDTALLIAFGQDTHVVREAHVDEAAAELRLGESATPPPKPTRRARRVSPASRPRPRLLWVAVALLAILLAAAWGSRSHWRDQLDGRLPWFGGATAAITPEAAEVPEVPEVQLESAEPVAPDAQPAAVPVDLAQEERRRVEGWRSEGRVLYSVHLASFRSEANAQRYANELVQARRDWSTPLYLEISGSTPRWYRVLGGGFRDRDRARSWMRTLKDEQDFGYAQLTRLGARAVDLLPQVSPSSPAESTGVEG